MEHPPRHNILFAGVQYLMLRDGAPTLAAHYPNLSEAPRPPEEAGVPFTEFVLSHAEELITIGRTRYTQTNEPRRCVALLPALWATGVARFHLVDFGTSAGLNLHLDRYRYEWGSTSWGPSRSDVELDTVMRGEDVEAHDIEILSRTGLDLNPLSPSDPDDRRWLEALVWPEHDDRRARLMAAMNLASAHPVDQIPGDGLVNLPRLLEGLPGDEPVLVINSFILNQFSPTDRGHFEDVIAEGRRHRQVSRVSLEWLDPSADAADLEVDDGSGLRWIGRAQPHGEWLELRREGRQARP